MIFRCALAAAIGFCQVFLIALQTRQLAAGKQGTPIFLTSMGISSIWVCGVVSVAAHPMTAPFYVLAAACGTVVAAKVRMVKERPVEPAKPVTYIWRCTPCQRYFSSEEAGNQHLFEAHTPARGTA